MVWKTNFKHFSWISHMKVEYLGRNKQLKTSLGDLLHYLCLPSVDILGLTLDMKTWAPEVT